MTAKSDLVPNDQRNAPAYPACNEANVNGTMGLTKRELFAAMALQGLCASVREYGPGRFVGVDELASDSVACADALLSALEQVR